MGVGEGEACGYEDVPAESESAVEEDRGAHGASEQRRRWRWRGGSMPQSLRLTSTSVMQTLRGGAAFAWQVARNERGNLTFRREPKRFLLGPPVLPAQGGERRASQATVATADSSAFSIGSSVEEDLLETAFDTLRAAVETNVRRSHTMHKWVSDNRLVDGGAGVCIQCGRQGTMWSVCLDCGGVVQFAAETLAPDSPLPHSHGDLARLRREVAEITREVRNANVRLEAMIRCIAGE